MVLRSTLLSLDLCRQVPYLTVGVLNFQPASDDLRLRVRHEAVEAREIFKV